MQCEQKKIWLVTGERSLRDVDRGRGRQINWRKGGQTTLASKGVAT